MLGATLVSLVSHFLFGRATVATFPMVMQNPRIHTAPMSTTWRRPARNPGNTMMRTTAVRFRRFPMQRSATRHRHQQHQTSSRANPPHKATGMDWKCSKTAGNADLQVGTTAARWPQPTCLALSAAWRLLRTHSNNNLTTTDYASANLSCQLPAQLDRRVSTVHRERCCQLCALQRQFLLAQPFAASQS